MTDSVFAKKSFFFIGIAGTGMSALAHYLACSGKDVSGSDRYFGTASEPETRAQLEKAGVKCFPQDASGINENTDIMVISTAVEDSNIELQKAKSLNIPVITRPELLAAIANEKHTIAVGGTAGKSTTTAMIFHILHECGLEPSMINGAGSTALQETGITGNAWVGKSDIMIIEADESNGTIVNYTPDIALVLNMGRDHKEDDELLSLFQIFKDHTKARFIVNRDDDMVRPLSANTVHDFGTSSECGFVASDFSAKGFSIEFKTNGVPFSIPLAGRHNMMNAVAAVAAASALGVSVEQSAEALKTFRGIYRRLSLVGTKNGITVIDDFAHNPNEVVTAIKACREMGNRVFAWFQPHGFGPLRFMHDELTRLVVETLREDDVYLSSDVFYSGGTVNKDINSDIVTDAVTAQNKKALFLADRNTLPEYIKQNAESGDIILLMGARDPTLGDFAKSVFNTL